VAGVGDAVGPYRIEALPGEGGMGQVFRAAHAQTGDLVALKLLRPEFASDEGLIGRLLREARAARTVTSSACSTPARARASTTWRRSSCAVTSRTPASDVYAFGCPVYACAAGRPPFGGRGLLPSAPGTSTRGRPTRAPRSDAPQGFAEAVGFALRKAPADRPSTATAYARPIAVGARAGSG